LLGNLYISWVSIFGTSPFWNIISDFRVLYICLKYTGSLTIIIFISTCNEKNIICCSVSYKLVMHLDHYLHFVLPIMQCRVYFLSNIILNIIMYVFRYKNCSFHSFLWRAFNFCSSLMFCWHLFWFIITLVLKFWRKHLS
jgi:hypothetical protein